MSNSLSSHRAETCEPAEPEDEFAQQQTNLIKSLLVAVRNFFGGFGQMFQGVHDPCHPVFITYSLPVMLTAGVLMFLLRLGARRQIDLMLRQNGPSSAKFKAVFGVETSPHGGSVDETFKRLIVEQVQESVTGMTEALIRKKVLYCYRLFDRYFLVSIDGTGMLTFPERHCPHCLTVTRNGRTIYYHPILEAKLVTRDGLVFSLMTEFVKSPAKYSGKQDCELKAFYRLAERLEKRFPRLPICLLLDGLFAGGPTFSICEKYHWKYIVVLQEKDLPSVQKEFNALLNLFSENHLHFQPADQYKTGQDSHWVNDIEYVDSKNNEHTVSVARCLETKPDPKTKELETTRFKWITNFKVKKSNLIELLDEGGRLRWKIENEGFNVQKNGGYALEHIYTHDPVSAKVFYLLLQIAHTVAQLIEYGSLFRNAFPSGVGSAKNIAPCRLPHLLRPKLWAISSACP